MITRLGLAGIKKGINTGLNIGSAIKNHSDIGVVESKLKNSYAQATAGLEGKEKTEAINE